MNRTSRWALIHAVALLVTPATLLAQEIRSRGGPGLWSNPATWTRITPVGGTTTPTIGDHVIITQGNPVTLDTPNGIGDLARLEIHDTLTVGGANIYKVGVSRIDVGGQVSYKPPGTLWPGKLLIGSPTAPFQPAIEITLTDRYLSSTYSGSGLATSAENMTFLVHGGSTLQMHGRNVDQFGQTRRSWLRLQNGNTLNVGDTAMLLESPPGWAVGDQLLIAPTDFDNGEGEVVSITGITGNSVQFTPALTKRHNGLIELGLVDERAEVGLLTHNIVVTSRPTTTGQITRGGHVMFHNRAGQDLQPTVNISNVEFRDLGWTGAIGRYPVHFHLLRSMAGSWVRSCSVWPGYNRGITVHGTDDVEVSDCVVYDTRGHSMYLEDRSEVGNQFLRNLVARTRIPDKTGIVANFGDPWLPSPGGPSSPFFHGSEPEVSCFWITNTKNTFVGNVAAGSDRNGYWYDVPTTTILNAGVLVGNGLWQSPPVTFTDNVAHSNERHGFWNDFGRLIAVDPALSPPQKAEHVFVNFTAYKNRYAGIWHRSYGVARWLGARLADNRLGAYLASEGFQKDGLPIPGSPPVFDYPLTGAPGMSVQTLEGAIVVGESTNNPASLPLTAQPYVERKGVELYDGLILLLGVQFHNFVTTQLPTPLSSPGGLMTHRVAPAISSRGSHALELPGNPWSVDARTGLAFCSFTNCTDPVLFPIPHPPGVPATPNENAILGVNTRAPNAVSSGMIFDVTGSVPGSAPNTYVVNDTPLLRPAPFTTTPTPIYGHYAAPLFVAGPGTAGANTAYGSVLFTIDNKVGSTFVNTAINFIRLVATSRGPQNALDVYEGTGSSQTPTTKRFPVNVMLTPTGGPTEEYEVSYPAVATAPRKFALTLQFSEVGRSALFGIDYPGGPPASIVATHMLFPGLSLPLVPANPATKQQVANGTGFEYFYDTSTSRLWIRPTLLDLSWVPLGASPLHPLLGGRAMTIEVQ